MNGGGGRWRCVGRYGINGTLQAVALASNLGAYPCASSCQSFSGAVRTSAALGPALLPTISSLTTQASALSAGQAVYSTYVA